MTNTKLRFRFREPTVDTNAPLTTGAVKIEGYDIEVLTDPRADCDVWDAGFAELAMSYSQGAPIISIPVFPNRKFRLSYIFVNKDAGIREPRDLEGKRVGVFMWGNTAGVWARGALQNFYGVDLKKVRWFRFATDKAPVAEGIPMETLPEGRTVEDLLLAGELDAAIDPNVPASITARDPRVGRLFPDWGPVEQDYYRETGIFPISHAVTFRQAFVDEHPDAPVALLQAYRKARDMAFNNVEGSDPQVLVVSWITAAMAQQRALMGDTYWAYNLTEPHNVRSLEAITEFAYQQGLSPTRLDYHTFFHPEAAALAGY